MATSAFGVEHGEIAKGMLGTLGAGAGKLASSLTRGAGIGFKGGMKTVGSLKPMTAKIGAGAGALGAQANALPNKVKLGAAGAGIAGASYSMGRKNGSY